MACIRKEEEATLRWELGLLQHGDFFTAWIGYSDAGDNDWAWINGCTPDWTNWLPSEPNDYCGGEDCAAITPGGWWIDISCRLRMACLCESPGTITAAYNYSVPGLRDDTCYADCGDLTKWCSAWPFSRLYDVDDDLCHWESEDGLRRGRGASECAARVTGNPECSGFMTYSVGRCRCSPRVGGHSNCMYRESDATSDIFLVSANGTQLVSGGRRCVYSVDVDYDYFAGLKPATSWLSLFKIWVRVAAAWLFFGVPCALIMICVFGGMWWNMCKTTLVVDSGPWSSDTKAYAREEQAYGPLLDTQIAGTGDAVNRWVFRASVGAVIYGIGLLALGATLARHMAGAEFSFSLELLESLVMFLAMAAVARAAFMIHWRLSPLARDIAGPWVLVMSIAKLGMSLAAFGGTFVFSTMATGDYESVCWAVYLFRWELLVSLPLQCLAGLSIWRIKMRAERYGGSVARAGGCVALMVHGDFGLGLGVWLAGYLGCVHEAGNGILAACFILAAVSQLAAGGSLLVVNQKVKKYFKEQACSGGKVVAATELGQPTLDFAGL